jgi:hypothetical protein
MYLYFTGMRIYEFDNNAQFVRNFWVLGGTESFPEVPRGAFAISATEIYIFGVSNVLYF